MVIISLLDNTRPTNTLVVDKSLFKVSGSVLAMILIILALLLALYVRFW
jgi:hypothetical protein